MTRSNLAAGPVPVFAIHERVKLRRDKQPAHRTMQAATTEPSVGSSLFGRDRNRVLHPLASRHKAVGASHLPGIAVLRLIGPVKEFARIEKREKFGKRHNTVGSCAVHEMKGT